MLLDLELALLFGLELRATTSSQGHGREFMEDQKFVLAEKLHGKVTNVELGARGDAVVWKVTILLPTSPLTDMLGSTTLTISMIGHPVFDANTQALVFLDLELESEPAIPPNMLAQLRNMLIGKPFWLMSTDLESARKVLATGLSKALGPGMSVSISSLHLGKIDVRPGGFHIESQAEGVAELKEP